MADARAFGGGRGFDDEMIIGKDVINIIQQPGAKSRCKRCRLSGYFEKRTTKYCVTVYEAKMKTTSQLNIQL